MEGYAGPMKDALTTNDDPDVPREAGYVLHVSDRTTAAMQLAAHFTAQSMVLSATADPRARLAEQLSYFDLAFSARVGDKYSFRLGANNLLDKQPPIVGGEVANAPFGNGNTFPQVYDALGRFLFAGVTINY